jgi:bacteriocin biosynthesis cyclodehydratase domain-containing protein
MRPMLKPALVRLWRDESTLQFGADPQRAVVVAGVSSAVRAVLDLLDGTRELPDVVRAAAAAGIDETTARTLLDQLGAAGLLDDGSADTSVLRALEVGERDRLAPELGALSLLHRRPGAALTVLARRRAAHVAVTGPVPFGAEIERMLLAAGVGRVTRNPDPVRLLAEPQLRRPPDLVVVTGNRLVDADAREAADRLRAPHLAVVVRDLTGIVGPLVRPGVTACLRCLDLHRADRDPAWPLMVLQLASTPAGPPPVCPAALTAVVAGTAAGQALAHLDGAEPAVVNGTLELAAPDWRIRRRSWPPHPDCSCGFARAG